MNYKICSDHGYKDDVVRSDIRFGGNIHKRKFIVKVPCPVGSNSTLNKSPIPSEGMGGDRLAHKILIDANETISKGK